MEKIITAEADGVLRCPDCGIEVKEDEKYCIGCGTPRSQILKSSSKAEPAMEETELGLQTELYKIFSENKILSFLSKYYLVLVLLYPIHLLMGRFGIFENLYEFLDNFYMIFSYALNIGYLVAYANKKFLAVFVAAGLRALNSFIMILRGATPFPSICRIVIIVASLVFLYKVLMTESQRKDLLSKFRISRDTCPNCGCSLNSSDAFCPKCGNKM